MLSKKNSRLIDVEGQKYRWSVSGDSGYNVVIVQHAEANGQRLETIIPLPEGSSLSAITPSTVAQTIKDALKLGWRPEQKSSPLQLSMNADELLEVMRGLGTD